MKVHKVHYFLINELYDTKKNQTKHFCNVQLKKCIFK